MQQALTPLGKSLLAGLGGDGLSPALIFDTDHGHLLLAGIPALDLRVDMEHYADIHHKSSDTMDKVVAHNLVAGAGVVAITAHALVENRNGSRRRSNTMPSPRCAGRSISKSF